MDIPKTILNLANVKEEAALKELSINHIGAFKLVGKDLTDIIYKKTLGEEFNRGVYFTSEDTISKGDMQFNIEGKFYKCIENPSFIETVIVNINTGYGGSLEKWKLSRYYDSSEAWHVKGIYDRVIDSVIDNEGFSITVDKKVNKLKQDEYEMYNLTLDMIEGKNLYKNIKEDIKLKEVFNYLNNVLIDHRLNKIKRITKE